MQVPSYLENVKKLKAYVDEVIIYCVNDAAVMRAWGRDQGVEPGSESMVKIFADPYGKVTQALDMELQHPGPIGKGLVGRSKRYAMYLEDGVVKYFSVSEKPDDPAGDEFPESSCAEAMIEGMAKLKPWVKTEL